jgi:DNA-binding MarR family transcriptional regulator
MSRIMRKKSDIVNHPARRPSAGAGTGSDEDVLELVHAVMHRYRSLQYRALRDGPHDITHMDSKVLGYFDRHPGATQMDLATRSGRDRAQIARLIKSLREQGLLDGKVDAEDRRNVRLSLTPEGKAVQRAVQQQAKRLGAKAVAGLSAEERESLVALLHRVSGNLGGLE